MEFPDNYYALNKNKYKLNKFSLIPIRYEHRNEILLWRNEQLYHLRQNKKLNVNEQEIYFNNEIRPLFKTKNPSQILFSFLCENNLVGYGGLVHINWLKKNAELSFLIKTKIENKYFRKYWDIYISLIEKVAFNECGLRSIYTYSFNLRPDLYKVLKEKKFIHTKTIKNAKRVNNKKIDALIHEKWDKVLLKRKVQAEDINILFQWNNDEITRNNSLSKKKITWVNHKKWFFNILKNEKSIFFIFYINDPVGSVRLDKINDFFKISFVVSPSFRGMGYGKRMINQIINEYQNISFIAEVLENNIASQKIFLDNEFLVQKKVKKNNEKIISYVKHV